MNAFLEGFKGVFNSIKWPAVKLSDLTSASVQELALVAVVLALLLSSLSLVKMVATVIFVVVVLALIYRFVKDKFFTDTTTQ